MSLGIVDVSRSEVLRGEPAADAELQAAHAEHAHLSHVSLIEPDGVLHEVVLVGGVLIAVHAIPLSLAVMELPRGSLLLVCHHKSMVLDSSKEVNVVLLENMIEEHKMAKFHLKENGEPGRCRAFLRACPLGGEDEHYSSKEEARAGFEEKMAKVYDEALLENVLVESDNKEQKSLPVYVYPNGESGGFHQHAPERFERWKLREAQRNRVAEAEKIRAVKKKDAEASARLSARLVDAELAVRAAGSLATAAAGVAFLSRSR